MECVGGGAHVFVRRVSVQVLKGRWEKRRREWKHCQGCWWAAERLSEGFWDVEQLNHLSRCSRVG